MLRGISLCTNIDQKSLHVGIEDAAGDGPLLEAQICEAPHNHQCLDHGGLLLVAEPPDLNGHPHVPPIPCIVAAFLDGCQSLVLGLLLLLHLPEDLLGLDLTAAMHASVSIVLGPLLKSVLDEQL
jgi:hypothetical protein